jgi:nicotinamidase-related amidase
MTLSCIDPQTALIVVDLQVGLASLPLAHSFDGVVERAMLLADAFRLRGLPVVLVNNDGVARGRREQNVVGLRTRQPGWAELVPGLHVTSYDHRITKRSPGAFTATPLLDWLRDKEVTQVVVAGVATGTGVEMTARQAYEAGFNVTLATDAMTDMDLEVHVNSITRIFPRIGETGTVGDIIKLLP